MTRHTTVCALRSCRPLFPSSTNGYAALSSSARTASRAYPAVAPRFLRVPSALQSRPRHVHNISSRLSSAQPQPKTSEAPPSHSQPPPPQHQQPTTPNTPQPDDLNPPPSTRPPPLTLPVRQRTTSLFTHLFTTGKAYLTFYKSGLGQIWTNYRSLPSSSSALTTRSDLILLSRSAHDMRRLPMFAILLLICGEFTPFVVLVLPQLVPYTCRIPRQIRKLRTAAEGRRAVARQEAGWRRDSGMGTEGEKGSLVPQVEYPVLARVLGVVGAGWDRVGYVPGFLARRRVEERVKWLLRDDEMLEGRVGGLVGEEVELACVDRGINTVGRSEEELRRVLERWIGLTREGVVDGEGERRIRMEWLLLRGEREWPESWPPEGM